MRAGWASAILSNAADLRRRRSVRNALTIILVTVGPILAIATYLALRPIEGGLLTRRFVLTFDFVYVLVVLTLLIGRVTEMVAARRANSAGSQLHIRLAAVFGILALVPTVLVAIFAMLSVNSALESWFSERVRNAVGASLSAAQAYQNEQQNGLIKDVNLLAWNLSFERRTRFIPDGELGQMLFQLQPRIQRELKEIFVVNNLGAIRLRGPRSYQFDFEEISVEDLAKANEVDVLIIEDFKNQELRALKRLEGFSNHYLYVARAVDGELLALLNETTESANVYSQLESDRGQLLFDFGLLYLVFAVLLILAATWVGLWFAGRLARPIGRLTAAAQRVGAGDLAAQVEDTDGEDEIAMLGRYFNQMTHQLHGQRDNLIKAGEQVERRGRLFDSVLSSVTSGVVGLDQSGRITFVNRSAQRALLLKSSSQEVEIHEAIPEFAALFDQLSASGADVSQDEVKLVRGGKQENLLVRIATRENDAGHREGFVIAFEDVTDLVSAQRMAAWGDVARRIAHEIKNPLTPIKLSAERIQRKFVSVVGDDADQLKNMTSVIVRQTDDLRHIVDEFSRFARMPEPELRAVSVSEVVRDAVTLQESGQPDVTFKLTLPEHDLWADLDQGMMGQALGNLLKNAGEAILQRRHIEPDFEAEILIDVGFTDNTVSINIMDNGPGWPADRAKLFEPYVTHRDGGTGLGLSIVLKIIEEHNGTLALSDAPSFGSGQSAGAQAEISLPRVQSAAALHSKLGAKYG